MPNQYADAFMAGMLTRASTGRHVNVLRHMAGYLRRAATISARSFVSEAIDDYAGGVAPRAVPVALLEHNLREHNLSYLARQSYFDPYPKELVAS